MSNIYIDAFYTNSLMFLKVAEIVAKEPEADNEYHNVGEFQNAISYNLCTSFELFLKFAILSGVPESEHSEIKLSHSLTDLYTLYKEIYPGPEYIITIPIYPTIDSPIGQLSNADAAKIKKMNFDQMLKYPYDRKLNTWSIGLVTRYDSAYINKSKKDFDRIFQLIKDK